MKNDLLFALRLYRRNLKPVVAVVLGLGLAVGLTTALFATLRILTDKSIDLPHKEQLRRVSRAPTAAENGMTGASLTIQEFREVEAALGAGVVTGSMTATALLSVGPLLVESPQPIRFVSAGFFDVTGGHVTLGRRLAPDDQHNTVSAPAVISHGLWTRHFGADPAIVGQTVQLNERPFTIVGVAIQGFAGPEVWAPAFWAPLGVYDADWRDGMHLDPTRSISVGTLARLQPGTSQAALLGQLRERFVMTGVGDTEGFAEARIVSVATAVLVFLILLMGCANVATLLAASYADRRAELATRAALGATRSRLWRQLITEGLLLSAAGGALGMCMAVWLGRGLLVLIELPPTVTLVVDWPILCFGIAAALTSGLLASVHPSRRASRRDLRGSLDITTSQFGGWAVAGQALLCTVAIVAAGLLARGASRASVAELGFDETGILTTTWLARPHHSDDEARHRADVARSALMRATGVQAIALAVNATFGSSMRTISLNASSRPLRAYVKNTTAEFATVMGLRMKSGRYFSAEEVSAGARVVVIDETIARAKKSSASSTRVAISSVLRNASFISR
jgi:hypothetical protein